MEDASKVRLVRCPKCQNLLPEHPNYSIYQCGGCGAVLRAKNKGPAYDGLSEKSDGETGRGGSEKAGCVSLTSASENEGDGLEHGRKRESRFSERTVNLINSSSPRTENREPANDFDGNMSRETMNSRLLQTSEDREVEYYDDRYRKSLKRSNSNRVHRIDHDMTLKMKSPEFLNSGVENQPEEIRSAVGNLTRSLRSRLIMNQWSVERNESVAFRGGGRGVAEQGRFLTLPYSDEGPSNHPAFCHGYGEQNRIHDELDGPSRVENLEHNRAELLRELEELKDQLSRSCDVAEKPNKRVPVDRSTAVPPPNPYVGHDVYMPNGPTSLYSVNMQPFAYDKLVPKPLYFNHSHGPAPYINSQGSDIQEYYPLAKHVPSDSLGFGDSYLPPMPRRPPHQPPCQHLNQPYHNTSTGQYMDFNQGTVASHPHETFYHQSACSCLHCYNKNWQVPPEVPAPVFSTRNSPNDPTSPIFYHHVNPVTFGPVGYNSGDGPPQLHSVNQQPERTSSSNYQSDTTGFGHVHSRRVVIVHGKRFCQPIAGGAPFIACYNCFELLKLPRRLKVMGENQQKLKCGACSTIILFELEGKGLVFSISKQINQDSAKVDEGSGEKLNENLQCSHGCSNAGTTSDDFDNTGYNFQLTDDETNILKRDQKLNSSEFCERQDPLSSCSSFSEDEQSPDSVIVQRDVTDSAVMPSKDDILPLPDYHLRETPVCSPSNSGVSRYGKGNRSKHNDQEKVILDRSTSRQNSAKDVLVATEMEVSFNEYLNNDISQDSMDVSKEEDQPRVNKGSESFFVGLIKKSFRDFSRSSQSAEAGQANVFVNGQPIPDRVVKKAEKRAGPIQSGEYWYDFRGGFWGVMGQPCLGIIPPFIEEFNYPMPVKCAAGNTGVFVNGRELHQQDLDLLTGRGLPTVRDKSYIIEISGKVLDEDTGEELDSLGKLAPTVQKSKHGFGMKVVRKLA